MKKIKNLMVHGTQILYSVGAQGVAEIRELSQEYEDHIHNEFLVLDAEGNWLARVVNCPVAIDYEP
ncbi:hypothetical protein ABE430_08960 [Brevibacillus agri]|uniref:hypothetical protein n=1 Tax=Brevibacillus agri TaxID=51101 RepID=UPI003D205FE6